MFRIFFFLKRLKKIKFTLLQIKQVLPLNFGELYHKFYYFGELNRELSIFIIKIFPKTISTITILIWTLMGIFRL